MTRYKGTDDDFFHDGKDIVNDEKENDLPGTDPDYDEEDDDQFTDDELENFWREVDGDEEGDEEEEDEE